MRLALCIPVFAIGCSSSGGMPIDGPGHTPGTPGLGAHGLSFYHLADPGQPSSTTSISTPKLTSQASGSTIIVSVGRGDNTLFASPTDRAGNSYQKLGDMHAYVPLYPESGTALYGSVGARGGSGFQVTTTTGQNAKGQLDEITIAAVEVVEGTHIQAFEWNEPTSPPLTSRT